jgi:hypothetical protein
MSIYITGDTHGNFQRFSAKRWPGVRSFTEGDIVIVAGDFGLLWSIEPSEEEMYWRKWLTGKPWTLLFVCGNHENHPRLKALPTARMYDGNVGVVDRNIFYLRRGEIYTIQDRKIFTFGGADSIDKAHRTEGISWWPEEIPSYAEMDYGLNNLEQHQYAVDYIITHTGPQDICEGLLRKYGGIGYDTDPTRIYLQHVCSTTTFKGLYCGHWHEEYDVDKYHFLYERIVHLL